MISPSACTSLSAEDMRKAIEDAAHAWELAAPSLDFVFAGFTELAPVPGDGHSVIGCVHYNPDHGASGMPQADRFGQITEADMTFPAALNFAYVPCEQRDDSCTEARAPGPRSNDDSCCAIALNSIATHEFGHWLWLADMHDPADRELTMGQFDGWRYNTDRSLSTLALGDVLGVRSLYPCSCPLPPVYSP